MKQYDYIICGAGAAGLSLLMRLMQQPAFSDKNILVIDKAPKNENDHTWCFWEKQPGLFEPVVHQKWEQANFFSADYAALLNLAPYEYKMIRSVDLYNYVYQQALQHANVNFIYGKLEATGNAGSKALAVVDAVEYTADYVFNSVQFSKPTVPHGKHYLLQHFKGLVVETNENVFRAEQATLMDFRVPQDNGTSFVYVLPFSASKALVEYTVFSKQLLQDGEYDVALQQYISTYLQIKDYSIAEQEFGIIPMTNVNFVKRVDRVINIGTAGGQTKGSSGYTFQFIQKHSNKIVNDLLQYGHVKDNTSLAQKRFNLYDSIMLNVLSGNKLPGSKIFADLFSKNPTERVLRFLDNETSLEDEINLMATLPQAVFAKAAFEEIFK